jgi:hypothetical protein
MDGDGDLDADIVFHEYGHGLTWRMIGGMSGPLAGAIGEGASFEAQEQIKNLGSQNVILKSVKPPEEQKVTERGSQSYVLQYGLTYKDISRIRATIPGVTILVPSRIMRDYVWNISRRVDCDITGTVPWYPQMRNHHVAQGRFFTDADMDASTSVCVLGAEMAKQLFPMDAPLGRGRSGSTRSRCSRMLHRGRHSRSGSCDTVIR